MANKKIENAIESHLLQVLENPLSEDEARELENKVATIRLLAPNDEE